MKSTNFYRNELKKIQASNRILDCLRQASSFAPLDQEDEITNVRDSTNLEAMIQDCHREILIANSVSTKELEIKNLISKKSVKILFSSYVKDVKEELSLRESFYNQKPNNKFPKFRFNLSNYSSPLYFAGVNHKGSIALNSFNKGSFQEMTSSDIELCLLLNSNSLSKKEPNEQLGSKLYNTALVKRSIDAFLNSHNAVIHLQFMSDGIPHPRVKEIPSYQKNEGIKAIIQDSNLLYIEQTTRSLSNQQRKSIKGSLSEEQVVASLTNMIMRIDSEFLSFERHFDGANKVDKSGSVLIHHLVAINQKLNQLEAIAYNMMTSVSKAIDEYTLDLLSIFCKVYFLLYKVLSHQVPKTLIESLDFKYYVPEILKLKAQEKSISGLMGQLFYNVKRFLAICHKNSIERQVHRDIFFVKPVVANKKLIPRTLTDLYSHFLIRRNDYEGHFLNTSKSYIELSTTIGFITRVGESQVTKDANLSEACKKVEALLRIDLMASYLDVC